MIWYTLKILQLIPYWHSLFLFYVEAISTNSLKNVEFETLKLKVKINNDTESGAFVQLGVERILDVWAETC